MSATATYKWVKPNYYKLGYELRKDDETVAKLRFAGPKGSKAWAEFNNQSYELRKSNTVFSNSIIVTDEESGMRICQIKNLRWYDMAKGTIVFEDDTIYLWQVENYPQVTFTIFNSEGIQLLEYKLNDDFNKYEVTVCDRPINNSILLLLLSIGWYSTPKLNTVEYTENIPTYTGLEFAF